MECWLYNDECLKSPPPNTYGFCYIITCSHKDYQDYIYVGRKSFMNRTKKRISKKTIKETKTRKRVERGTKHSGWEDYWGSSVWMNEVRAKIGNEFFSRKILSFAKNKTDLSLQEWEWIIKFNVLRIPRSFNLWASGRIYKKHL